MGVTSDADDLPVVVYEGSHDESLFLASLLQGSGIAANFVQSRNALVPHRVVVAQRDVPLALPLVANFKQSLP